MCVGGGGGEVEEGRGGVRARARVCARACVCACVFLKILIREAPLRKTAAPRRLVSLPTQRSNVPANLLYVKTRGVMMVSTADL